MKKNFEINDIVQDHDGRIYLFCCYSLVDDYCIVKNKGGDILQIRYDKLKRVICEWNQD